MQVFTCSNPNCSRTFKRRIKALANPAISYCSRSCAVSINNTKFPKNPAVRKNCAFCNKEFISREKYCSVPCKNSDHRLKPSIILDKIKQFYLQNKRIPLKSEFIHAHAARKSFGSWNKTIIAAGFTPNPVKFSKKYLAKDKHMCDSLAEMLIDDWLYTKDISHQRSIPYPNMKGFTVDFVVGKYWIEFFGLYGQHKRYDELRLKKLETIKQQGITLIEIYPKHLFPKNQLETILKFS